MKVASEGNGATEAVQDPQRDETERLRSQLLELGLKDLAEAAGRLADSLRLRDQAEQELRVHHDLYRRMVETVPGGVVHVALDGSILYANRSSQRIGGMSQDELLQKRVHDFAPETIWEDGRPCAVEDYPVVKCLATGKPQPPATIGVRRAGQPVWWAIYTAVPVHDPITGQLTGAITSFLDITDRKQAELSQRESEERFHRHFQNDPIPIYIWQRVDDDFVLRDFNGAAGSVTNGQVGQLLGRRASELYADTPDIGEDIRACFSSQQAINREMEYRYRTTNETRILAVRYVFVPADLVMIHTEDITHRTLAERSLRESERRFRQLFDASPVATTEQDYSSIDGWFRQLRADGVTDMRTHLEADPDALLQAARGIRIVRGNVKAVRLFEAKNEEHLKSWLPTIIEHEGLDVLRRVLIAFWDGRNPPDMERSTTTSGGHRIHYLLHWSAPAEAGKLDLSRVIVTRTDITERRNSERLVEGTAHATHRLLTIADEQQALSAALADLGAAADVDRVSLLRRHEDSATGEERFSMVREWCGPGIASHLEVPLLQDISYSDLGAGPWYEALMRDGLVSVVAQDLPEPARALIAPHGIQSMLLARIVLNESYWGLVGCEDCRHDRRWSDSERSTLLAVAASIGAAIERHKAQQALLESRDLLEQRVEERTASLVEANQHLQREIAERTRVEKELREEQRLLKKMLDVHERDRRIVAYEIHDGLVQYATAALMHLEAFAQALSAHPSEQRGDFDLAMSLLRDTIRESRRLITGLRPMVLDEAGIVTAIEYLAGEAAGPPPIRFFHAMTSDRLPSVIESALFRACQEAVNNARKYSQAQEIRIELVERDSRVRLTIVDDGIGFEPAMVTERTFGLQGIRERARLLGGAATIESAPGQGTRLVVDLPI